MSASSSYTDNGRSFAVLAAYPATEAGAKETNEYLIEHPKARVLKITADQIIVVSKDDAGIPVTAE